MFTLEAQSGRALPEMLLVCTERERERESRYTTERHLKLCSEVTAVHLPWAKACHKDEPDTEEECGL